jgi:hypothetical protein
MILKYAQIVVFLSIIHFSAIVIALIMIAPNGLEWKIYTVGLITSIGLYGIIEGIKEIISNQKSISYKVDIKQ